VGVDVPRCGTCGQHTVAPPSKSLLTLLAEVNAEIKNLEGALERALDRKAKLETALSEKTAPNRQGNRRDER
jgi:hypothetical protein